MEKYAVVDRTNFPIVRVQFTGEAANEDSFKSYLMELKEIYDYENKLAIIFDANKATLPGLKFQKMQAKWLKDNKQMMEDYCVGTAYIISNRLIRNVLKAIFALQSQPVPFLVCSRSTEAEDWVDQQLC
jgi:hypothetical protein